MRLKIIISAVLTLSPAALLAAGVGTTGAQFLKVGVGARELGLGSAAGALSEGANAVNWNPARLAGLKGKSLSASYNMLFIDESQGFIGYAGALNNKVGVIGVGVNYLTVGNIEKRLEDTQYADSKFSNNNTVVNISYAKPEVWENVALGLNLKYIEQAIDTKADRAVAFDLGSTYKVNPSWTAALAVKNLGSKIGPDNLPLSLKGSLAAKVGDSGLEAAVDLDWYMYDSRFYPSVGAEYGIGEFLTFRAGYQFGRSADKLGGLTGLGAGLGLKMDKFNLDYAYVPFGDLGDTHRMTLGYRF